MLLERKFGMRTWNAYGALIPFQLSKTIELEFMRALKNDSVKEEIINGNWQIDEAISQYSLHTLLHEAILARNVEMIDFLISQKAHAMMRDHNGYTALLKAASIGDIDTCK